MRDADKKAPRHSAELKRLEGAREWDAPWRKWGPYLSERQWGTVREDYSPNGDAWQYFTHDQARSRAYHWGEDGLAGFCDLKQRLCFALALWNGKDPILKERLFGLSNAEGNHGEDVKEYYFYLDSTPTHSYMKWLSKYPQAAFPVRRPRDDERAPLAPGIRIRAASTPARSTAIATSTSSSNTRSRLPRNASSASPSRTAARRPRRIHLLPTLWFRNTWNWWPGTKPHMAAAKRTNGASVVAASHAELGDRWLYCDGAPPLLFTENDTNTERLFDTPNASPYVKDAFHAFVVHGNTAAVNPAQVGTKAAAHYRLEVGAGQSVAVRLCLTDTPHASDPFAVFEKTIEARRKEADEFYRSCTPDSGQSRIPRTSCGRRSAACSGRSSTTSSTSTCGCASTASTRSTRRRRCRSGTATGSTCSTTT